MHLRDFEILDSNESYGELCKALHSTRFYARCGALVMHILPSHMVESAHGR